MDDLADISLFRSSGPFSALSLKNAAYSITPPHLHVDMIESILYFSKRNIPSNTVGNLDGQSTGLLMVSLAM